jgi:hypothetical protein
MGEKHWMEEPYGIPHKNGYVRFYIVGFDEDVFGYLGWFDMTDWEKGWDKVFKAAVKSHGSKSAEDFQILRHDQILDLMNNVQRALQDALEDKDETTFYWWYQKEEKDKND